MRNLIMSAVMLFVAGVNVARAEGGLEVSIALYRSGKYVAPIDSKIVVGQRPLPFYVLVRNSSKSAVKLYETKGTLSESNLEFELVNAKGAKTLVTRKHEEAKGRRAGFRMMVPGAQQMASVLLHQGEWNMDLTIPSDKDVEFTVRVIYINDGKKIYSLPYKVTIRAQDGW
jgi:hypothetical protein